MWNLTHNILYLTNVAADILKVIEKHGVTYGDWPGLQNVLEYTIAGSNENLAKNYKDLCNFTGKEPPCFEDEDPILYANVIPNGKYPVYDDDDYFIQHPMQH